MKRILTLSLVLLIAMAGLYLAQRRKHLDTVSSNAILDVAADLQRDLSRAPMQLTRLQDDSEVRIGNGLAEQYLSAEPSHSTEAQTVENYVSAVGNRVAARAHRRLPYRFHLVADPDLINAFALPGGHVFVGLGLLHQMTSEDELASVLGHEIEHIDHYHAAERIQIEAQLKKLDLDAVAALTQIPLELWQAGYSKEQELEADREGLRLATAAGYSPQGALNLFDRWAELHREYVTHASTPVDELSQVAIEGLQGYFRSHPLPEERLEQAKRVITEDGLDATKPLTPLAISSLLQTKRSLQHYDGYAGDSARKMRPFSEKDDPNQSFRIDGKLAVTAVVTVASRTIILRDRLLGRVKRALLIVHPCLEISRRPIAGSKQLLDAVFVAPAWEPASKESD